LGRAVPVSVHTGLEEHEMRPVWHSLAGVQLAPIAMEQATQFPATQTSVPPQLVPLGTAPACVS
jgi:hypothetical protein